FHIDLLTGKEPVAQTVSGIRLFPDQKVVFVSIFRIGGKVNLQFVSLIMRDGRCWILRVYMHRVIRERRTKLNRVSAAVRSVRINNSAYGKIGSCIDSEIKILLFLRAVARKDLEPVGGAMPH